MSGTMTTTIWGVPCDASASDMLRRRMRLRAPEGHDPDAPKAMDVLRMVADVSGVPETDILDTAMRTRETVAARRVLFGLLRACLGMSCRSIGQLMREDESHKTVTYAIGSLLASMAGTSRSGNVLEACTRALWSRCEAVMAEIGWPPVMTRMYGWRKPVPWAGSGGAGVLPAGSGHSSESCATQDGSGGAGLRPADDPESGHSSESCATGDGSGG